MPPIAKPDSQVLSLTPADLRAITEAVAFALSDRDKHTCRIPLTDAQLAEVAHAAGMIADIGNGDLRRGVEILRENNKLVITLRERTSQAATAIGMAVLLAITGGLAAACWVGLKLATKNP